MPRSALSGRLLSLGSNACGQLGLGTPTAPAEAEKLQRARVREVEPVAAAGGASPCSPSGSIEHARNASTEVVGRGSNCFDEAARAGRVVGLSL